MNRGVGTPSRFRLARGPTRTSDEFSPQHSDPRRLRELRPTQGYDADPPSRGGRGKKKATRLW